MSTLNKKIKILECIRQGQIGGGESHLLSLVENLNKSRFEPVVLSFTDGPMIERLNEMKIETHVIHSTRPFDVSKWKKVKSLIRNIQPHIVHAHGTRANSNVLWPSRAMGIPVIYTIHGWSFHQDQKRIVRQLRIQGEKYLTRKSNLNIAVSESNQLTGKHYLKSFDSIVINNGIDLNRFNPQKNYKNIRAEFGIPEEKTLVLFIARFTSHKQPLTLIRSFAKAFESDNSLHLLMVGDGDQKAEAIDLINRLKIGDHVNLEGFRKDVPEILSSADIFVLPSLWEGLPIGLLEACGMGKAIIATDVDGTKEIIRNGYNGILINTDNLENNLTHALIEMAANKENMRLFGNHACKTINENFNAANMTRQIEAVYEKLSESNQKEGLNRISWSL